MEFLSLVTFVRAAQVSLRRECYKHTVVVKVCKCLDPVVWEKRIYKLVWPLTGQSFAKLSLYKHPPIALRSFLLS